MSTSGSEEAAGSTGMEGDFQGVVETGEFVPRNLGKMEEIRCLLPSFGWEAVRNWCPVQRQVVDPWDSHSHGGCKCHPRVFVRIVGYPTVRGERPSLDALLKILQRDGGATELDTLRRRSVGVGAPAPESRSRRRVGFYSDAWLKV